MKNSIDRVAKTIIVKGVVQGVGFRYATLKIARTFEIKGFVRNQTDNSVLITAEGTSHQMELFIKWCYEGPPHAIINNVILKNSSIQNFAVFEIRS